MTLRTDSHFPTATEGLTNARTRIVGNRTGFWADAVVTVARIGSEISAAVRRVVLRVASVVTPLGWTTVALLPVVFVIGYSFAWTEFVAAAWAGVVLVVVAVLYLVGRTAVDITLELAHPRVVVGEIAEGTVIVRNPGRRRSLGVMVEVPVGVGLIEIAVPSLAAGAESVQRFSIPTARRGTVTVGPARTVRADPIGLVRRELTWTGASELVVHPRTIGIPSLSTGLVRDLEGSPTRELTNSDVSFHALREYQRGDERRYIHWKSTAKTGTHMVRQFEQTRRSHLIIALSLAAVDYTTDEEFELAVSVAGSLGARAIRDIRDLSVVVSERTPEFAKRKVFAVRRLSTLSRSRLLDELAVVESAETALALTDVARVAGAQVTGISLAFLICGAAPSPTELRAASTQFPIGVEVIAVVCDPGALPELRKVAGLSVLTIGYLEDLTKSLAKATAI
ncbi:MAG: DUF58 domain-containing protein [Microbacteriaceae bacterium]